MTQDALMINLGCGSVMHAAWLNLDVQPFDPRVRPWDITRGVPIADGCASACYASHVLEHLPRDAAARLVAECRRVLAAGGVLRVAVPDLESIAREYLAALDRALTGDASGKADYDWMMLELLDQMVRTQPGGGVHSYLTSGNPSNAAFIRARIGMEAEQLLFPQKDTRLRHRATLMRGGRRIVRRLREEIAVGLCAAVLGPRGARAMREGLFRRSGEVHLWMYDRYSLRRLLEQAGFTEVRVCTADESRIPHFGSYGLETTGGRARKPDSLFMEGVRP